MLVVLRSLEIVNVKSVANKNNKGTPSLLLLEIKKKIRRMNKQANRIQMENQFNHLERISWDWCLLPYSKAKQSKEKQRKANSIQIYIKFTLTRIERKCYLHFLYFSFSNDFAFIGILVFSWCYESKSSHLPLFQFHNWKTNSISENHA